jgi:ABC-2 type transport system permease protein
VTTLKQLAYLGARAFMHTLRRPGQIFFALAFPLFFLTVIASGLDPADQLPGFPADSYLDFMLAVAFVHGALFAAVNAAVELGRDIETGFLNRLALTPASGIAIVLGNLFGAAAIGLVQFSVYLAAGLLAGVDFHAGFAGVPVLFLLATLTSLAFGAMGTAMALWTGSSEAVQSMFPLFFVAFFLSSMNMPRNLIETDWFRWVASANPTSYVIEGLRSLVITGWNAEALALGFGWAVGIVAISLGVSAATFRQRLTRT